MAGLGGSFDSGMGGSNGRNAQPWRELDISITVAGHWRDTNRRKRVVIHNTAQKGYACKSLNILL